MLGLLEDWPPLGGPQFMYHGLRDSQGQWAIGKVNYQAPRPVYHTVQLLAEQLDGYHTARELANAAPHRSVRNNRLRPPRPCVYQFSRPGKEVLVLWCEDGVQQGPGEREARLSYELPVEAGAVIVTHIITRRGQSQPRIERLPVRGGKLRLTLTETPVLVGW